MPASPPASSPPPGQRRKVLFVEDEQALHTSYQRYFAGRYEMGFARTGAEALSQLDQLHPDVLVLDLRLPDTDRKSTRLNSSHPSISYAVFCLKKKTQSTAITCFQTTLLPHDSPSH